MFCRTGLAQTRPIIYSLKLIICGHASEVVDSTAVQMNQIESPLDYASFYQAVTTVQKINSMKKQLKRFVIGVLNVYCILYSLRFLLMVLKIYENHIVCI